MSFRRLAAALTLLPLLLAACGDPVTPGGQPAPAGLDSAERVVDSPGDTLFASVAAGPMYSCALTRGGRAFCWGSDTFANLGVARPVGGCLGNGADAPCSAAPVPVDSNRRFVALSAGARACGLTVVGRVWCWGGSLTSRGPWLASPEGARYAALGDAGACAARTTGGVDCFSWAEEAERLAVGPPPTLRPVPGSEAYRFSTVGASCGVTTDGAMLCWDVVDSTRFDVAGVPHDTCHGGGWPGLALYHYACHYPPVRLRSSEAWTRAVKSADCCGVTRDGQLAVWIELSGNPLYYVRGWRDALFTGGQPPSASHPVAHVVFPEPVRSAFLDELSCAHGVSGRVWCWGDTGLSGLFGNGVVDESHPLPTLAAGGRAFVSMQAATDHACGVTADGGVLCWGENLYGQLGIGEVPNAHPECTFGCVATPTPIASVARSRASR
jgi:hypothetical protein